MDDATLREIVARHMAGECFAVGLLVRVQGSAPQKAGARLLVLADGTMRGTVGGGCLEMETRRRALIALRTGEPERFTLRLDDDFGWDDGLICGGIADLFISPHPERFAPACAAALAYKDAGNRCLLTTILSAPDPASVGAAVCMPLDGSPGVALEHIAAVREGRPALYRSMNGVEMLWEPVLPDPTLVILGCGHIGTALTEMAAGVGFRVVAVDDRADYASSARLPWAAQTLCEDLPTAARTLPSGPDTYWVIVTRGHRNDGRVLAEVIGRPSAYVGMIGSRRKVRLIKEGLLSSGAATSEQLASLHAPVGLDIGAETPREIALAIAAQLVAVRRGRPLSGQETVGLARG